MVEIVFWISLIIVFYTFIGYGLILWCLVKLKSLFVRKKEVTILEDSQLPAVTFVVAAYNEQDFIVEKLRNTLALDYPQEKLNVFFVTDGSDDKTPSLIEQFFNTLNPNANSNEDSRYRLFHQPERRGKIAAVERVIPFVSTSIIIFSDANTLVNKMAIRKMVAYYQDPKVGAVAGEKRINMEQVDDASSSGEGFYWKYESTLKKLDAALYSVVGAAGELFSIRTQLHESIPADTIIEDFYITLKITQHGYKVAYAPEAYAVEHASLSVQEELKRKIRIAAGGLQAIYRLSPLLNIFKYGWLSFQYISHRVLRWTLAPLCMVLLIITNLQLALTGDQFYLWTLIGQLMFYLLALIGYWLERKKIKVKILFIPYYFCVMNYAVYAGFLRIVSGNQTVLWEKAKRKDA